MINKKAEISVQTFFFVMMVMLMILIIVFGINKFMFVEKVLSDQELVEIRLDLQKAFEYCEDPLNRGSFTTIEISNNYLDGICVNSLSLGYESNLELKSEFDIIKETGNNLILLKDDSIIDSFKVDYNNQFCSKKEDDFKIKIEC